MKEGQFGIKKLPVVMKGWLVGNWDERVTGWDQNLASWDHLIWMKERQFGIIGLLVGIKRDSLGL